MKQAAKQIRSVGVVVLGNAILTFAIAAFVLPNRLISGGVTGIALVFEHFFAMDVSAGVAVANGVLFLAGAVTTAIPGIILHIILIPALVIAMDKARLIPD